MLKKLLQQMPSPGSPPKEGDLYREVTVGGRCFRLLYGYYEDADRSSPFNEPIPIYPDFIREPVYTREGAPVVTAMQDVCDSYRGKEGPDGCSDCLYFQKQEELFGICSCLKNKSHASLAREDRSEGQTALSPLRAEAQE